MTVEQARRTAEKALQDGRTLYLYKANNGQWMADGSKEFGKPPFYTVKEFLAAICGVRIQ